MRPVARTAVLTSALGALAASAQAVGQVQPPPISERATSLSAAEHAARADAMFDRIDADRDGHLTAAELQAAPRGMMGMDMGMPQAHGMPHMPPTSPGQMGQGQQGPGMMGPGIQGHSLMGPAPGMPAAGLPGMADRDGDGAISAQEHAAGARAIFERIDINRDGRITQDEIVADHRLMMGRAAGGAAMAGMGGRMAPVDRIRAMDRDGDGRASRAEHAAWAQAMFQQADTDNDGNLSMAERAAHHAEMMRRMMDAGHRAD